MGGRAGQNGKKEPIEWQLEAARPSIEQGILDP
jgi:hypothetical protein